MEFRYFAEAFVFKVSLNLPTVLYFAKNFAHTFVTALQVYIQASAIETTEDTLIELSIIDPSGEWR